jgi:formylglycine-generating enzyme required for sulfatase activity
MVSSAIASRAFTPSGRRRFAPATTFLLSRNVSNRRFCRRYRPAARQPQEADFSSGHIGFRVVRDIPPAGSGPPE